jgi:hypothetical protein
LVGDRGWRQEIVMSGSGEKNGGEFKIDEEFTLEGERILYINYR